MGGAARTAFAFALAWVVVFSLCSRIVTGLWPGALTHGVKILAALALAPALLGLMGESAVHGVVRPGTCVLQRVAAHSAVAAARCVCVAAWARTCGGGRRSQRSRHARESVCGFAADALLAGAPDPAKRPHAYPFMDNRPGTIAARQNNGNDTLWVRLAPNPDYTARDATTGRATGVYAQRPVAHDVDDTPRRSWFSASWNLIRPWRTYDAPWCACVRLHCHTLLRDDCADAVPARLQGMGAVQACATAMRATKPASTERRSYGRCCAAKGMIVRYACLFIEH
jgi:hypothetical protein